MVFRIAHFRGGVVFVASAVIFHYRKLSTQYLQENPWYMVNFFAGIIPLDFLITWVYVKSKRSIFACMVFHFFVNFLQEQVAMTQVTKCVETLVLFIVAGIVVLTNRDLFFDKRHIGNLLSEG